MMGIIKVDLHQIFFNSKYFNITIRFFGGGGNFGNFGKQEENFDGQEISIPVDVTLEDLYNGKLLKVNFFI
jgi:DnaJ-class molecular chaperone